MPILFQIKEVGGDLVLSGSGSFDTTSFNLASGGLVPKLKGQEQFALSTSQTLKFVDNYTSATFTGPTSIGTNNIDFSPNIFDPNSDDIGVIFSVSPTLIQLPLGYVSNDPLFAYNTYPGLTYLAAGLTLGTYVWSNPSGESITLIIGEPVPTPTPTPTPTQTPTQTPTNTPTQTPTQTPTNTPTQTPTNTPTQTPTNTPTQTPTQTPTNTPTQTPTNTPTQTPTQTPTNTPTQTPTNTPTPTQTVTPTNTPTQTPTNTPTPTPSKTPTDVPRSANTESNICQEVCTSGGTTTVLVEPPHPVWTDGKGIGVVQLNMITLGGPNGLNS